MSKEKVSTQIYDLVVERDKALADLKQARHEVADLRDELERVNKMHLSRLERDEVAICNALGSIDCSRYASEAGDAGSAESALNKARSLLLPLIGGTRVTHLVDGGYWMECQPLCGAGDRKTDGLTGTVHRTTCDACLERVANAQTADSEAAAARCIHVRPRDDGQGWAVDVFDGRRAWSKTHLGEQPLNKAEAHRLAHKLRDPKFYTARTKRAVNSEGSIRQRTTSAEACAAVACSDDPREMVRVAFDHWNNIGWPEDKGPVALLKRALELLGDA